MKMERLGVRLFNKKWDILLIGGLLLVAILLFVLFQGKKTPGGAAVVRVSGEITAAYALAEDRTVTIEGKNGGTNTLVIENGTAHLSEASCPDKLCVHQGTVSRAGQTIICLPNEVVIEIMGTDEGEEPSYDAISQ